jgi:hypothetical protein
VDIASALVIDHVNLVLGLTIESAVSAETVVQVVRLGELEDSAWAFIPFRAVFLGVDGRLTQTFDPSWAFVCVMGTALSASKIMVDVRPAVILNP